MVSRQRAKFCRAFELKLRARVFDKTPSAEVLEYESFYEYSRCINATGTVVFEIIVEKPPAGNAQAVPAFCKFHSNRTRPCKKYNQKKKLSIITHGIFLPQSLNLGRIVFTHHQPCILPSFYRRWKLSPTRGCCEAAYS